MRAVETAALATVATLAGCASGERMVRLSPFGDDEPAPDRINLWPLWYADGAKNAVLWPLVDWDDHGFAVRPLAARDDDELDLLWPLAHVELESGSFWALTAYRDVGSDLRGLFPLVGWGQLNYLGPAWWTRERAEAREIDGFGLFPLVWRDRDADTTVVFPLWWDLHDSFALAPFWWHDRQSESRVLFPLWWEFAEPDGSSSSQTLFPLWHYAEEGDRRRLITPLGGRGWSADGTTRFVNVLGPLWHHSSSGPDEAYTAVVWPLFTAERDGAASTTTLLPLWSHEVDPARQLDETSLLLGAGRHRRDLHGESWRAWPLFATSDHPSHESFSDLFTLWGRREQEGARETQVGTALLFQFDQWDLAAAEADTSWEAHVATLLSFGHDATPTLRPDLLTAVGSDAADPRFARDHVGVLFDWFLWESTTRTGATKPSTPLARHQRIPLLFERESDPTRREWDALLWCVHSTETSAESRFVVGWGLYRSVDRGDRVSRDLFPFMTWDEDAAADRSSFSFLWRLWHRERRGDRTGGHFLFFPWGEEFAAEDAPAQ